MYKRGTARHVQLCFSDQSSESIIEQYVHWQVIIVQCNMSLCAALNVPLHSILVLSHFVGVKCSYTEKELPIICFQIQNVIVFYIFSLCTHIVCSTKITIHFHLHPQHDAPHTTTTTTRRKTSYVHRDLGALITAHYFQKTISRAKFAQLFQLCYLELNSGIIIFSIFS